jgi:hypothetical protein
MSEKKILGKKTTNLDNLDDEEIRQKIKDYLINYYKSRLKGMPPQSALEKLEKKISKKLRLPFSFSLPVSGLPKALANFTVFSLLFYGSSVFSARMEMRIGTHTTQLQTKISM